MKKKKNLKKTFKKNKEKTKEVSLWLRILVIILVILAAKTAFTIKSSRTAFLGIIIGLLCANICSRWAKEINKSRNWAYAAGFFFGLLGLLIYWLYYRNEKKKKK